jgi:hypothetical protein
MKYCKLSFVATAVAMLSSWILSAQISVTTLPYEPPVTHFDEYNPADASGLNNTIPEGWIATSTGVAAYNGRGPGTSVNGGYWGYGITEDDEWSLGALRSTATGNITYTLSLTNNTGFTIHEIELAWDYEQWRYAGNTSGLNCTGLGALAGNGSLNNSDFTGAATGTNGIVSVTPVSIVLSGLNIVNGAGFGISWVTTDITGSDNGVALDNFSISACSEPSIASVDQEACSGELFIVNPAGVPQNTLYSWDPPTGTGFTGGASGTDETTITGELQNTAGVPVTATYTVTPKNGNCVGASFNVVVTLDPCAMAASLEWVLLDDNNEMNGSCVSQSDCDDNVLCFGLSYTPGTTGVLTSYTTQFAITCAGPGNTYPVISNQSCRMTTGNANVFDVCVSSDITFFQANGNGGTLMVTELVPVIIHQICLSLLPGENVTISSFPGEYTASFEPPDAPEFLSYSTTEISSNDACLLLPVTWLGFNAVRYAELQSLLTWSTAEEFNNSHFIIERSTDNGKTFQQIGRIEAGTEPVTVNQYSFIDKYCSVGRNLYRIAQMDLDGRMDLSAIREVRFDANSFTVSISPNPAQSTLKVILHQIEDAGSIKIVNALGQIFLEHIINEHSQSLELDISDIHPGLYSVIVESGKKYHVEKVLIVE